MREYFGYETILSHWLSYPVSNWRGSYTLTLIAILAEKEDFLFRSLLISVCQFAAPPIYRDDVITADCIHVE